MFLNGLFMTLPDSQHNTTLNVYIIKCKPMVYGLKYKLIKYTLHYILTYLM